MRGGNIKQILDRFVNKHWEKEVTARMVKEWITKTVGLDISVYILGQYLRKHKSFQFIKRTNKGRLYRVINPLDKWMDELKTI